MTDDEYDFQDQLRQDEQDDRDAALAQLTDNDEWFYSYE